MLYTGIDLIEIQRIERAIARWGARFLRRVYTAGELSASGGRPESLAARWAAKEATAKLLGVGLRGIGAGAPAAGAEPVAWTDIEVESDPAGRPVLSLHGRAAERARALGISELALSLSHSRDQALASVVAVAADRCPPTAGP